MFLKGKVFITDYKQYDGINKPTLVSYLYYVIGNLLKRGKTITRESPQESDRAGGLKKLQNP